MAITREQLETMDFSDVSDGARLAPVHPGEVLLHDYLEALGVTQHALAVAIGVPPRRINEINQALMAYFVRSVAPLPGRPCLVYRE